MGSSILVWTPYRICTGSYLNSRVRPSNCLSLNGLGQKAVTRMLSLPKPQVPHLQNGGLRVNGSPGFPLTDMPRGTVAQWRRNGRRKGKVRSRAGEPLTHLQEVSHALEKGRDTRHRHSDGGRSHARPPSPRPCRSQQIPQELRELKVSGGGLRGWRLGGPPRGRACCGCCVGGASTG